MEKESGRSNNSITLPRTNMAMVVTWRMGPKGSDHGIRIPVAAGGCHPLPPCSLQGEYRENNSKHLEPLFFGTTRMYVLADIARTGMHVQLFNSYIGRQGTVRRTSIPSTSKG